MTNAQNQNENILTTIPPEVNPAGLNISKAQDSLMAQILGSIDAFTSQEAQKGNPNAQAIQADSRPVTPVAPQFRQPQQQQQPQPAQQQQQAQPNAERGQIPYDRFAEVVAEKNAAAAEAKAMRERLAQLEAAQRAENTATQRLASDPVLNGSDGKPDVDPATVRTARVMAEEMFKQAIGASPQELQALLAERRVSSELGPQVNTQQAQAIAQVCQQTGLAPKEAALIAFTRNPSLFPGQDARGLNPAVHSQTSPTSATQQPQGKTRYDQMREILPNVPRNSSDFGNIAGEMLVDKIGKFFMHQ
jgi:hypothetical protein